MKKLTLLLFCLTVIQICNAQYLRGIQEDSTGVWHFVSVDIQTEQIQSLSVIPGLDLPWNPATINNNTNEYFVLGNDTAGDRMLYTIDAINGNLKNAVATPDVFVSEANELSGQIIGSRAPGGSFTEIVTVNPANGTASVFTGINFASQVAAWRPPASDLHQNRDEYYVAGELPFGTDKIIVFDLQGNGSFSHSINKGVKVIRVNSDNDSIYGLLRLTSPVVKWQFFSFDPDNPLPFNILNDSVPMFFIGGSEGYSTLNPSNSEFYFRGRPAIGMPEELFVLDMTNGTIKKRFSIGTVVHIQASTQAPQINLNRIQGDVYYDQNGNGVKDGNETPIFNQPLKFQPGNFSAYTNVAGKYDLPLQPGTYQVSLTPLSQFALTSSPSVYNITFQGLGTDSAGNNFGLNTIGTPADDADVDLAVTNAATFHLNTTLSHWITYNNVGNTILDGQITYWYDTLFIFQSTIPPPDSIVGNQLIWNFSNLFPAEQRQINVLLANPRDQSTIGLYACSDVQIEYSSTWPNNKKIRSDGECQIITAAWDPNDKAVTDTIGTLGAGAKLEYLLRFQNTGNAMAQNIVIRDTLNPLLDASTFNLISVSHDYNMFIKNNVVTWEFPNIMLPDSGTNWEASNGFVKFEIDISGFAMPGQDIYNEAGIYFDFNPVVLTNQTVTHIPGTPSVFENVGKKVHVYPNPTYEYLNILLSDQSLAKLVIYDYTGKEVLRSVLSNDRTVLPIGSLNSGIYLLQVFQDNELVTNQKVLKL